MLAKNSLNFAKERLEMELKERDESPTPTHISFGPVSNDDIFRWQGIIMGPLDTPFEGGLFHVFIEFPIDYPFSPPDLRFLTKVYHPNVNENGRIPMSILGEQWSPALTTEKLLLSICSILMDPILTDNRNPISNIYLQDRRQYNQTAREWTRHHAMF